MARLGFERPGLFVACYLKYMATDPSSIEHLVEVFLSGFRIPDDASPEATWKHVGAQAEGLSRTLSTKEAKTFLRCVKRRIGLAT